MSKILIEGNKIIIDGHANDLKTCNTLTNLCDELSTSEKFRTVKYESGYGEFESVSENEEKKFAGQAGIYSYQVNIQSNDGATILAQSNNIDTVVVTSTDVQLKNGNILNASYTYAGSKLFAGLATSANATAPKYKPGDTIDITAETTLYIVENIIIPEHHSSLNELFTNIAAVIREKTGESGTIAAAQFPSVIRNKLQAAPIGFYLSTNEGYSEFFPMTPGQTFNEFVASDNTGKFRINGIDLPTFFEIYYIDEYMDSVIVKNNNYGLKPIWFSYSPSTPVMLDPEGNNTANGGVAIVFEPDDYCNTLGIAQSEYINVGIAANTAVNRVLLHKDLSHIDCEISDWTIDECEIHFNKPFSDLKVITTAPITVRDSKGYLSSVGNFGQLIIPLPNIITDVTAAMALFTYIEDLSSPNNVRSEAFITDVYLDPNNGYVLSSAACIPVDFSQSKNIATTPCVISIIG